MTGSKTTILCTFLLLITIASCTDQFDGVVLEDVNRDINLQSQLSRIDTYLKVRNNRDQDIDGFYFAIPNEYHSHLSLLTAQDEDGDLIIVHVDNLNTKLANNGTLYYIKFTEKLRKGVKKQLTVIETYWGRMVPFPKEITLFEDQLVVYEDAINLFSPYPVASQKTIYRLAGPLISHSDFEGNIRGRNLEYSYQTEIAPFTRKHLRVHFENNTPFVVFKNVTKTIEISHWGNIYIEEFYTLANEGAAFTGEYSRVDYNSWRSDTGKSALKSLKAKVPVHAWGLHYRDEIGNVSTSKAFRQPDHVSMEMNPRYAIFGGWKYNWDLTYNLPTKNYLYVEDRNPNSYVLKQKFGFSYDKILCEDYTIKIIFPEGAHDINIDIPFEVDSITETLTFSYLDFVGRPTQIIKKENVLWDHSKVFQVSYTFENSKLLIEPFYLFAGFLALFAALIVLARISLVGGDAKVASVPREKTD